MAGTVLASLILFVGCDGEAGTDHASRQEPGVADRDEASYADRIVLDEPLVVVAQFDTLEALEVGRPISDALSKKGVISFISGSRALHVRVFEQDAERAREVLTTLVEQDGLNAAIVDPPND